MYIDDTAKAAQVSFVEPETGRATDVLQQQIGLSPVISLHDEILLDLGPVIESDLFQEIRNDINICRRRLFGTVFVVIIKAGIDDCLADSLATATAEMAILAKYFECRNLLDIRHGKAAVEAAFLCRARLRAE
jgi:hypothetical protein